MGCPRMYNHKERVYSNKFLASYPLSHSNGRPGTFRLATLTKSGILSVLDPTAKDKVIPHFNGGSDRKTYSSSEVEKMAHRHSSILFAGTPLYAHAHMRAKMKKGSTEGRRNGDTSLVSSHHVIMMESGSRRLTLVHHRCSIHWPSNLLCRGLDEYNYFRRFTTDLFRFSISSAIESCSSPCADTR